VIKKIFLISYWVNKEGNSPAIMADDKIESLLKLNYKVTVLSSFAAQKIKKKNLDHYRIPSLSFNDFKFEFIDALRNKDLLKIIFFLPFALVFGIVFDLIQFFFLKGIGGGKWYWSLTGIPLSIFIKLIFKPDILISTGGPASAHFTGLIISKLFKCKYLVYLQDPLVGSDIGRNSNSKNYLKIFEKWLVHECSKLVFVTKTAALEAIKRHKKSKSYKKIFGIYSGAVRQDQNIKFFLKKNKKKKLFIHVGTLYNSRNLDNFVKTLNLLESRKEIDLKNIRVFNLGDIYGEIKNSYLKLPYFGSKAAISRKKAIQKSLDADILLLVQHKDKRSKTTIPFKTYDYLNTKKVIFGMLNNNELKKILVQRGHVCANVNDIEDIAFKLKYLLEHFKNIQKKVSQTKLDFSHYKQTQKILKGI
jgi:hypothetical protein